MAQVIGSSVGTVSLLRLCGPLACIFSDMGNTPPFSANLGMLLSFPHPPFPPCHPTHPPSLSPAQSRPWPTHASLGRNPGSGHPQGGSGSTGLLSFFPSPRQDTPAREHPCPETVTSHTPQGHRDTRSEGPTPPILCAPPRTLTTPSPSAPLIADKARGPRARGERGKGAGSLPNSPLLSPV